MLPIPVGDAKWPKLAVQSVDLLCSRPFDQTSTPYREETKRTVVATNTKGSFELRFASIAELKVLAGQRLCCSSNKDIYTKIYMYNVDMQMNGEPKKGTKQIVTEP